jgi:hypothetical protein
MNKYFYCYSWNLKEFLNSNNEVSIVSGLHPNTKKKYWVFERNNNIDRLLSVWQLRKK